METPDFVSFPSNNHPTTVVLDVVFHWQLESQSGTDAEV